MKYKSIIKLSYVRIVAPFAGAWIEIHITIHCGKNSINVAPFAGAWIEIRLQKIIQSSTVVAPFAGAWIEIRETF